MVEIKKTNLRKSEQKQSTYFDKKRTKENPLTRKFHTQEEIHLANNKFTKIEQNSTFSRLNNHTVKGGR